MGVAAEMHDIVRGAALPAVPGESVKAAIGRSARRLRLGFARTRAHWYGLARLVPAEEADRLRVAARELMAERMRLLDAERDALRARLHAADPLGVIGGADVGMDGAAGDGAGGGPAPPGGAPGGAERGVAGTGVRMAGARDRRA